MCVVRNPSPAQAVALMLLAAAFIAATMLLAKFLGSDAAGPALSPLQITQGRFLFAFLALGSAALLLRPRLTRPTLPLHLARTGFGFVGVTLMFASVTFIPLGDATAISFLNPVFAMMLAIPLLGEKVGPLRWSAAGLALLGAMVLLRPTPASFEPGALLALGAAVLLGIELIVIKKLSGRESPFQILLINNVLGVVISSLAVLAVWQAPTPLQWGLLIALGLCMAAAQACFVNAMARADASFVAPFSYTTLVFAVLYDLVFFSRLPDLTSWLGTGIILSGAVMLALREAQLAHKRHR